MGKGAVFMIENLSLIPEATAKIFNISDLINPVWIGVTNINGKVVDNLGVPPWLGYGSYRLAVEHCDYDPQVLDFSVPDQTMMILQLPCSSALAAHAVLTSSVHNFDVVGDAPAQVHGNEKHSTVFEDSANKGMDNGYCELESGKVPLKRMPVNIICIEEYSNHLGVVDNFTQVHGRYDGTAITDPVNHRMDLNSGITQGTWASPGSYAAFESKKTWTLSTKPIIMNFIVNNITRGEGEPKYSFYGLKEDFSKWYWNNYIGFTIGYANTRA